MTQCFANSLQKNKGIKGLRLLLCLVIAFSTVVSLGTEERWMCSHHAPESLHPFIWENLS